MNDVNKYGIKHWKIDVVAWGVLYCTGTEEEAETWRRHKSNWERCIARKTLATPNEIKTNSFSPLIELL